MKKLASAVTVSCLSLSSAFGASYLDKPVEDNLPSLVGIYKQIHQFPELSHQEAKTSALVADELRKAGFKVTERVGKFTDGSQAYGVIGVLENGPGPRLLIRGDIDALPIIEETGVPYASQVRTKNAAGQEVGVMHACGHDIHTTTLIGTARLMAATRQQWKGTLVIVGQPAEETADGAKALLADNLYERFGRPDFAIALHDTPGRAAGQVAVTSGPTTAGVTSIDVVLRGVGAHGAEPQNAKDPVVMAGQFIVQLQTIVSREQDPRDPAVVTVGSIHGGTKRNVIPYEVKLELTTRSFSDKANQIIVDGVKRIARGVAISAGIPEDRMPIVTVVEKETLPSMHNNPALNARVKTALTSALGASNVFEDDAVMNSEDFGLFGLAGRQIPTVMFGLGIADPAELAAARAGGKPVPGAHTSRFKPVPEPGLRAGVKAMTAVATSLLQ
ncbi:amidohydrolase [Duganella sp. CY15W]|uniref:M20 metallopeptidase family protein n=1 Tax=Duganella sp. CY15W TaxID=2692172 RepID=UPI00136D1B1D|nr:amidohydrolase [Duganella sp. CY15W]MYM30979.1 amidohydrolase [Duganella sp. CY15W]